MSRVNTGGDSGGLQAKPHPAAGTALNISIEPSFDPPTPEAKSEAPHFNRGEFILSLSGTTTSGNLKDLHSSPVNVSAAKAEPALLVQGFWNFSGHGGSRVSLRHCPSTNWAGLRHFLPSPTSMGPVAAAMAMDPAIARVLVREARLAGVVLQWRGMYKWALEPGASQFKPPSGLLGSLALRSVVAGGLRGTPLKFYAPVVLRNRGAKPQSAQALGQCAGDPQAAANAGGPRCSESYPGPL